MKIIAPSVELYKQEPGIKGLFRHIERCGRTCYKSEDKITDTSADVFVQNMINRNHFAMLEHGTVYLIIKINNSNRRDPVHYPWYRNDAEYSWQEIFGYIQKLFITNPYSAVNLVPNEDYTETIMYITTNFRVIIENHWEDIMHEFMCEKPTINHAIRITLKCTTNIGVTREGNRMRANSIAEESTRYCNYSNDKFGGEITYCAPAWLDIAQLGSHDPHVICQQVEELLNVGNYKGDELSELMYLHSLATAEINYLYLIEHGWKPQQAREVLPLATKSEIIYTAFPYQWKHWFDLRLFGTTGAPHPNMKWLSELAQDVLDENNLWNLIYPNN